MQARKASKKPLYASAFELFCEGRNFAHIASQTGLSQAQLERCAVDQNWERRRGSILGAQSVAAAETRLQAQAQVDSTLVTAARDAAHTLASAYVKLIEEASGLPTHAYVPANGAKPDETEQYRQQCSMIERKAQLMRQATGGLKELIETAQGVGLLKVERGGKPQDGNGGDDRPIDLSKLTQLNIAIVQATNRTGAAEVRAELAPARASEPVNVTPVS